MSGLRANLLVASLLCLPAAMWGQAESAASVTNAMPSNDFGFNLPTHVGTLSYSLSASELIETGYGNGSVYASTALSGNLAYLSKSEQFPFSLLYTGGVVFSGVPGTSGTEFYQNIAASQVYRTRAWSFVVTDAFSYLPGSPTTGLSGVAGVGDVGVFTGQPGVGPAQSILTNNSSRISNGLEGSATWQMTPSLDLEGSANWQILKFTGNNPGDDTNEYGATFGPNFRIDARNSVGAEAYYQHQTYPGFAGYLIETEGANATYSRAWTRRLSTNFAFGPQRSHGTSTIPIPSQWNFAGNASATYNTRTTGFYGSYSRGVNAGSGVIFGALSDTADAGLSHPINRDWDLGLQVGYSHNAGLVPVNNAVPSFDSVYGSAQVSRRITETLSAYGSYSGISQSAKNQPIGSETAFNGLNNVFSIGITFAPAPLVNRR
jgi:hypothetical protein